MPEPSLGSLGQWAIGGLLLAVWGFLTRRLNKMEDKVDQFLTEHALCRERQAQTFATKDDMFKETRELWEVMNSHSHTEAGRVVR